MLTCSVHKVFKGWHDKLDDHMIDNKEHTIIFLQSFRLSGLVDLRFAARRARARHLYLHFQAAEGMCNITNLKY
jgi:hypothetical protein